MTLPLHAGRLHACSDTLSPCDGGPLMSLLLDRCAAIILLHCATEHDGYLLSLASR